VCQRGVRDRADAASMPTEPGNAIHRPAVVDAAAIADIGGRPATSGDVITIVAAALAAPDPGDLLHRAAALATTTRERQVVAIALAHIAGDADRVDALARDHLADHPDSVLVAWITASTHPDTPTRKEPVMTHTTATSIHSTVRQHPARRPLRPWWRWLLTALAFPVAGLIGHAVAGRVDSLPAAVLGGVLTGAGLGAAQWALLRHRGIGIGWIPASAAGLGAGLAAGAALVSYRTDIASLVLMGAVSGLALGIAQGAILGNTKRMVQWSVATAALWALGWSVTTAGGISVDQQFTVFGAYGAITVAFLQSIVIAAFVPKAVQS
jgi:hypothetical protein